jgi:hypothetical protein
LTQYYLYDIFQAAPHNQQTKGGGVMKKLWTILRIAGFIVCLFFFVSDTRKMRSATSKINQAQGEVNQAWEDLERAVPMLAEKYSQAINKQKGIVDTYSFRDIRATFLAIPLALLSASLTWQFVVVPIRTRQSAKQPKLSESS